MDKNLQSNWKRYIPSDIVERYEIYDFKHAAAILFNEFRQQFDEIIHVLRQFYITKKESTAVKPMNNMN